MPKDSLAAVSDETLLVLYANGDRDAARHLVGRLAPRVLAYAMRILGDRAEAEDIAQEAMVRLWKIAPDWRPGEALITTWLYRVVSNLATDRLRHRQRRRTAPIEDTPEVADAAPGVVAGMIEADRIAALQAGLDSLPERQRQAVVLRHLEGLSNPEIAAIMQIGVEAVESLTARGKRALAAALSGRRDDLGYDEED